MMLSYKYVALVVMSFLTSACSTIEAPSPETFNITANSSISVTAGTSQTFVRSQSANYQLCSQPMPDVAYDKGDDADINYSFINTSSDQVSAQDNSDEVEMAGRTPAILMAREIFYRTCEFSTNFGLNKQEALSLYQQTLTTVGNVWASEAQNTTVTVGDTIQDTSGLVVNTTDTQAINNANAPVVLSSDQLIKNTSNASNNDDSSDDESYDSDDN
jgi:predicted lipoprotein with Yx(FWY)xxD motif